jgi:ClpP class serine protease
LDDPTVDALLLNVDSPGGEATGINELGDMLFEARATKPIWSYVEGLGASAAYWLASATERIVVDATAALGSIGVVLAVSDPTKANAREIEFVSSQSPNKRPDPTSERGKAQLQRLVDAMAAVFVAKVARNRGVSEEQVLADFGSGGLLVGEHARRAGLADALGSFEGTLAELQQAALARSFAAQAATNWTARFRAALQQEAV